MVLGPVSINSESCRWGMVCFCRSSCIELDVKSLFLVPKHIYLYFCRVPRAQSCEVRYRMPSSIWTSHKQPILFCSKYILNIAWDILTLPGYPLSRIQVSRIPDILSFYLLKMDPCPPTPVTKHAQEKDTLFVSSSHWRQRREICSYFKTEGLAPC